jgi:hypothetical protein
VLGFQRNVACRSPGHENVSKQYQIGHLKCWKIGRYVVQINMLFQFIRTTEILCHVCLLYWFEFILSKVVLSIYFGANNSAFVSACVMLSGYI